MPSRRQILSTTSSRTYRTSYDADARSFSLQKSTTVRCHPSCLNGSVLGSVHRLRENPQTLHIIRRSSMDREWTAVHSGKLQVMPFLLFRKWEHLQTHPGECGEGGAIADPQNIILSLPCLCYTDVRGEFMKEWEGSRAMSSGSTSGKCFNS